MKKVISGRPSLLASVMPPKGEDPRFRSLAEMERVLSALANADAMKIFYAAAQGIKSSTQTIKDLDLTQKRYYTYLKNLTEAGLVEKVEDAYRLTTLGKICHKLGEAFQTALSQKGRLELVDKISKAKGVSLEETEEIIQAILKDHDISLGGQIVDFLGSVRMADTWDKVMNNSIEFIEKAEEEIDFATQYVDAKIINPILKAGQRGVKMRFIISEKENYSVAVQMFKSFFTNPRILKALFDFLRSNNVQIRHVEIPYSFFIVDRKYVMVEVPPPHAARSPQCDTEMFFLAFFFTNQKLGEKVKEEFNLLWEKGSELEEKLRII